MRLRPLPPEARQKIQSPKEVNLPDQSESQKISSKPRIVPSVIRIPRPNTPVEDAQS